MTLGGPQLELGIAVRAHLEEKVLSAIVQLQLRDDLGVAAFEPFRQTQQSGKDPDHLPIAPLQIVKPFV